MAGGRAVPRRPASARARSPHSASASASSAESRAPARRGRESPRHLSLGPSEPRPVSQTGSIPLTGASRHDGAAFPAPQRAERGQHLREPQARSRARSELRKMREIDRDCRYPTRCPAGARSSARCRRPRRRRDAGRSCRRQSAAAPHRAATSGSRSSPCSSCDGAIVKEGAGRCAAIRRSISAAVTSGMSPGRVSIAGRALGGEAARRGGDRAGMAVARRRRRCTRRRSGRRGRCAAGSIVTSRRPARPRASASAASTSSSIASASACRNSAGSAGARRCFARRRCP